MRAIHCLSSMPILQGRQVNGTFQREQVLQMPRCVLYTLQASALQWRLTNGSIKLYTDTLMKNYLADQDLLGCWDEVDTETLDTFYKTYKDIDFCVFWSAGKFACYLNEKAPFVCIDTDLIVWKRLCFDKYLDFGFAHWEQFEEGDESYPHISKIAMPPTFNAEYFSEEKSFCNSHACNMSITYFGNDCFREEFANLALDFMRSNPAAAKKRYATPEILFIEQRVPLMLAHRNTLNYAPVIPCTWSPKQFRLIHPTPYYKHWFFADLNAEMPITHLWFHKKYLSENPEEHEKYCEQLLAKIPNQKTVRTCLEDSSNIAGSIFISSRASNGKRCNETGCSQCGQFVWIKEGDPDIPERFKEYTHGPMKITWCQKYSTYLGPYPPCCGVGGSHNASI